MKQKYGFDISEYEYPLKKAPNPLNQKWKCTKFNVKPQDRAPHRKRSNLVAHAGFVKDCLEILCCQVTHDPKNECLWSIDPVWNIVDKWRINKFTQL